MSLEQIEPVDEALLMGDDASGQEEAEEQTAATVENDGQEVQPEDEPQEEAKPEKEQAGIPKWRFDEVNEQRKAADERARALEAELAALRTRPAEQAPPDVRSLRDREDEIETKIEEALYDGTPEQRKELRAELRKVRDQIGVAIREEAEARAESRVVARLEQDRFVKIADVLATKYPVLDSKTGNQDAIDHVILVRDSYIAKGMSLADALEKAADKVAPLYAKEAAPAEATEDPRKAAAIKRGADTNNAQAPRDGGVGNRAKAPSIDVGTITQRQWEKMSAAEREKLLNA